jgi:hypothetical protein
MKLNGGPEQRTGTANRNTEPETTNRNGERVSLFRFVFLISLFGFAFWFAFWFAVSVRRLRSPFE